MQKVDIFPWDERFNTGLSEIDEQHRKLVEILNRLARCSAYDSSEEDFNGILDELSDYTLYHFKTEEAVWHQYLPLDPLDSAHQEVHQKFVDTVLKLKGEQETRPLSELAEEAITFLVRWLASHLLKTDRYMAYIVLALQEGLDIDAAKAHADELMKDSTSLLIDIILSIYSALSSNTMYLMRELKIHQNFEKETNKQERYRDLLLELSTEFITLPLDKIDLNIEKALEKMANYVGADRAYIFDYYFKNQTITNTYEWCASDISPQITNLQNISISLVPGWHEIHSRGEYVLIQDVPALKNGPLRDLLFPQDIKSLVTFPIFEQTTCKGFVGFDAVRKKHNFSHGEITLLELFSKLLSNVAERIHNESELEHKEHYQRALLDNFPFMVWLKDEKSRFLALNQPMADACGFHSVQELIGKTDYDIWPKNIAEAYRKDDAQVLSTNEPKMVEEAIVTSKGKIWSETYKSPIRVDGKVIGIVGFSRDITDRKELERNLIKERDLFERYLNTVEAIIVSLDEKGNIVLINRKGCELLGYSFKELVGQSWFELCLAQPNGMQKAYPAFLKIMSGDIEGVEYLENHILNKVNEKHLIAWHNACLFDDENNIVGVLSSGEDITILKEQQKRLEHMAHYDTLTNLPNRILLSDRLHQAMLQTKRHKLTLAVIYLDLDGFKEVNDTYGHSNGDILLKSLSSRIKQILRDGDTIARLGGDEFVIVLYDLKNKEDSIAMLNRILNIVSKPIVLKEISMQVSASLGVTFYNHGDVLDADQLLRQADQSMYQAKLSGKNRFHIFDVKLDEDIRSHHESLEAIEKAIQNEEFVMHYQPKVNMRSGKVLGAEALIRWEHPEHGLLYPGAFLPAIENHHLSVTLGAWVINNVMQQIQKWKKEKNNIVVSINISPLQLQESDFIVNLLHLLKTYPGVEPSDFEFEILESSALEDISHVSYIMKECNKIGVAFLLDDFGTGYSSLTYLKNLPAKQLKIDQSFVRDMLEDTDDMAILEGIISLANAFRRDVIAEGVETLEQGKMLLQLGCEEAQGYVIAKPMPAEKLIGWITQWRPPLEWQNIATIPRDDTPLLYAITEHRVWISEVISYIKGNRLTSPQMHHEECRFGTWVYTHGMKRYEKRDGFKDIVVLHQKIHDNINALIKQYEDQSLEDINHTIENIENIRDHFLEEFTKLLLLY